MTPGSLGPPILPVILEDPRHSPRYSHSQSTIPSHSCSCTPSPQHSSFVPAPGFQPPMMGGVPPTMMAPFGPGMMAPALIPVGGPPVPQQVMVMAPLCRPSEYHSPTLESRSPSYRALSRTPSGSRYADCDRFEPGFQPAPVSGLMPMPATCIGLMPYPSYPRSEGCNTLDHGHHLLNGIALSLLKGITDIAKTADLITQVTVNRV